MNKIKLTELFFKMRKRLNESGRFEISSNKIADQLEKSYFFNTSKVICLYNHYSSVVLNKILINDANYFRNSFVFPRLEDDDRVLFYHISSPKDLIMDRFGVIDVVSDCFTIDIAEIDVILVSGMAFDYDLRVLNIGDNDELYKSFLNKANAIKFGVCLDCQIYRKSLPESEYRVDGLLTEEGIYLPVDMQEV